MLDKVLEESWEEFAIQPEEICKRMREKTGNDLELGTIYEGSPRECKRDASVR